ncbi:BTB/POZ domain-containing protein At3g56230-like [Lolium rigidum]|uniref:BTB/POZ domain-containing protein At3g56230-like n=1 Tax=Lolium rigidum TaxID=89674 RepID=UPI001F5D8E03|nr:BTB/POZ domain-containing protein At3g56230-like [Lolium rigidum]
MDCCICGPMAAIYRPPRNTICFPCYEGAKSIIAFLNDDERAAGDGGGGSDGYRGLFKHTNSSTKGMAEVWEQVKEMRDREEEANQRAGFLEQGFGAAWMEGAHTDIVVKPGNGPPIPAHKAILAARSEVFRHMLCSDECKAAPASDCVSLPELAHDELSLLLAFLYTGTLDAAAAATATEASERRMHALLVAADKYDVPFLGRACEARLAAAVDPENALRTLEVADRVSSCAALKERAMGTVVEHAEQVVFSDEYHDFAVRNAGLCVEITRALLAKAAGAKRVCTEKSEDVYR